MSAIAAVAPDMHACPTLEEIFVSGCTLCFKRMCTSMLRLWPHPYIKIYTQFAVEYKNYVMLNLGNIHSFIDIINKIMEEPTCRGSRPFHMMYILHRSVNEWCDSLLNGELRYIAENIKPDDVVITQATYDGLVMAINGARVAIHGCVSQCTRRIMQIADPALLEDVLKAYDDTLEAPVLLLFIMNAIDQGAAECVRAALDILVNRLGASRYLMYSLVVYVTGASYCQADILAHVIAAYNSAC